MIWNSEFCTGCRNFAVRRWIRRWRRSRIWETRAGFSFSLERRFFSFPEPAVLLSLLCGMIVGNLCLKNLVMRPRPCWIDASVPLLIPVPHDYSFPSGHTLAAFETAVSIFLVNRKWGTAFLIFAALIGLSRMYLFVHFPTDVLSGAALGIFIAWFVKKGIEKYRLCDILRVQKNKKAE